jgi:signal transduction histidine kinase
MVNSTGLKPMQASRRLSVKFALAAVWLVFTVALAAWWMIYGLNLHADPTMSVARQQRMLFSEGIVLIALLLGGGLTLLYNIQVESRRARRIEEFFASFTHDLKTSLASLRIQTESLRDDLETSSQDFMQSTPSKLLARIMSDAGRLETQLENALFLADAEKSSMLLEPVSVRELMTSLAHLWPRMKIEVHQDAEVLADRRAIESIVRNIAQNSSRHGQASRLDIYCDVGEEAESFARVRFVDDGRGFHGDTKRLGEIFARQTGLSGSGIGLYLVARLVERLGGTARVATGSQESQAGFLVEISLPRAGHEVHA